jgi:penicillin-binding protein-related factor A (putative recombinase)
MTKHEARMAAARQRVSHSNRGKRLEQVLDLIHRRYARQGVYVQRNGVPFIPRRRRPGDSGPPMGTVGPEAPPDYLALSPGCVPILFDAKSTEDSSWSFSLLELHQARALDAWSEAGGVSGLVVALDKLRIIGWVPWPELSRRWHAWYASTTRAAPGTASLTEAHLQVCEGDWLPRALAQRESELARVRLLARPRTHQEAE